MWGRSELNRYKTKKELVHNQLDDTVKSQKEMSYFVWPDKSVDVASIFLFEQFHKELFFP